MKAALILFVDGLMVSKRDIYIPEASRFLSSESNCKMKYQHVEAEKEAFKRKTKYLLNTCDEYQIYLVAQSKLTDED